jgi:sec-independent protein translocase protein TatA
MLTNMKGWEWLIIVALILLLFGAKRLPDAARGLGRSMRIFKAETKGLAGNDTTAAAAADAEQTPATPTPPAEKSADA